MTINLRRVEVFFVPESQREFLGHMHCAPFGLGVAGGSVTSKWKGNPVSTPDGTISRWCLFG